MARFNAIGLGLGLVLSAGSALAQTHGFTLSDWPSTAAELKPVYVSAIMEQAGIHQVRFERDADFYTAQLDRLAAYAQEHQGRLYLTSSVAQNLATLAVVHCDWNNGVAPKEFALKFLGREELTFLAKLYPEASARLERNCQP